MAIYFVDWDGRITLDMAGKQDFKVRIERSSAPHQGGERRTAPGGATDLPTLWTGSQEHNNEAGDLLFDGLGIAVTGAITTQCLAWGASPGQLLHGGVNLLIPTYNTARVFSMLDQILRPLRTECSKGSGAVAAIEQQRRHKALERAKEDYQLYRHSELLPDAKHLAQLARKIGHLEYSFEIPQLLANPIAGHLAAAVRSRPSSRWLATFDDFGAAGWLEKERSGRAIMDADVVTKSWYQQNFQSAYLEGLLDQPVMSPRISVIIVAAPQIIATLLLSPVPHVAGLVSCCWMIDGTRTSDNSPRSSYWTKVIEKVVARNSRPEGGPFRMNSEAADLGIAFANQIDLTLRQTPTQSAGFLGQLPRLLSKISLNSHVAQDEPASLITKPPVQKALARVERTLKDRQELIYSWREVLADREFEQRCEAVLVKIVALGPIGARDLSRSCHEQRLEHLAPVLSHLVRTEQIVKHPDGRFDILERWLSKLRVEIC